MRPNRGVTISATDGDPLFITVRVKGKKSRSYWVKESQVTKLQELIKDGTLVPTGVNIYQSGIILTYNSSPSLD